MKKMSEIVRKNFGDADRERDAGLTTPDSVIRYDDIKYGFDSDYQVLDVYRPKDSEERLLPVIVSVHGGGWVYGTKEVYQFYCMSLAQRGFAVVNFSYRLAPEHKFPAPIEDTNSVFNWVFDNADEYGFDTDNIFAVGDSAGAHNLGIYTCICTNPQYARNFRFDPPAGFVPKAVALNCGCYKFDMSGNPEDMTDALMKEFLPNGASPDELELIRITNHITSDFPPTFAMTAIDDFLKHHGPLLVEKLTEVGVPFIYRMYGDNNNRLAHVFHCNIKLEDATLCNDEECEFFKKYID